jgi:crossover junction endodeoxyribonuclease RuvC
MVALAQGRISCPARQPLPQRLARLATELDTLVREHRPSVAALETPFHGMNARTLIVLAQARGALLATLALEGVEIHEYAPAEVKSAVSGNGRASKQQVARMVEILLGISADGWSEDTTDALAVAICCGRRLKMDRLKDLHRSGKPLTTKGLAGK